MNSDEEVVSVRKKKFIIQSESEDENPNNDSCVDSKFTESGQVKNNKTTRLKSFESSSEDEDTDNKSTTIDPNKSINTTIAETDESENEKSEDNSIVESTFIKRDKGIKKTTKKRRNATRLKPSESSSDEEDTKSTTTNPDKTNSTLAVSDDTEDNNSDNDSIVKIAKRVKVRKNTNKKRKNITRLKTFDSSSDSDEDNDEKSSTTGDANSINNTLSENFSTIENPENPQDENSQENSSYKNSGLFVEEDDENDDTLIEQKKTKHQSKKSWYNNDLFEDESSGDESKRSQENKRSDTEEEDLDRTLSITKPSIAPKERASKKKALNEIQEIQKESQRQMRQSYVSIPYHRPRQRTLAEFRARRTTAPAVSLRTSSDKLASAWKAIEQREKEAEIFYKSESSEEESESEEMKQSTDVTEQEKSDKMSSNSSEKNDHLNLGEVQVEGSKGDEINNTCGDSERCTFGELDSYISSSIETSLLNPNKESIDESRVVTNIIEGETLGKESAELEESCEVDTDVSSKEPTSGIIEKNISDFRSSESEQYSGSEKLLAGVVNKTGSTEDKVTKSSEHNNSPICESNVKNNSVNTEEFSLRMSESQPELGMFSQQNSIGEETNTLRPKESNGTVTMDNSGSAQSELEMECSVINYDNTLNKNTLTSDSKSISNSDTDSNPISQQKDCLEERLHGTLNGSNEMDSSECKLGKKYNLSLINSLSDAPKMTAFDCEEILLDEVVPKSGVDDLIERFFTHLSYKKKAPKKKVPLELSVVSAETDSAGHVNAINNDVVTVMVGEEEEEEDPALAKPGAKLARLRAQLQAEMERQRREEWQKKQQDQKLYEEEMYEGEKDICDAEEDDEPEEDPAKESEAETSEEEESDQEDEAESDEEECDGGEESGKQKKKSAFIDDEAEESDNEEFVDKDEEGSSSSFMKRPSKKKIILERTKTVDMFLSQEGIKSSAGEEEEWPSFQKPCQVDKIEEEEESDSPICPSPAFRLTALEGKDITRTNWSGPPTPCKDFASPKTVTPVRSGPLMSIVDKSPSVSSQDLENLCSGRFVTQPVHQHEENNSQDFQLFLADDSQLSQDQENTMDSPIIKTKSADGKDRMRALLADEDDDFSESIITKKAKKLNFSDDEEEQEEDNKMQLKDDLEESDVEEETAAADEIEYDSEENEVVKTAGDFLDKEAELSESEWGSEDEDEYGLDILDTEEADKEKIDERRLQQQLGQIHMKQLLVEDKEKVRRLQELLLDDGELHSENRRRKLFRWSNNITFGDDNKVSMDSDEDRPEEDEDEESWRKERHAREQFLSEYSKKAGTLELAEDECFDSKLFQLGQKTLQQLNKSSLATPVVKTSVTVPSPDPKRPLSSMMTMKRGSFLSRGQQVLSRLAQIVSSSDGPINQPKNSRNFVFASISPTKVQGEEEVKPLQTNKRKMPVLPLPVAKKPCIQKPKIANKKSLFEALAKVQS